MVRHHAESAFPHIMGSKRACCLTAGTHLAVASTYLARLDHRSVMIVDLNFD
jgi:hypothetical protein